MISDKVFIKIPASGYDRKDLKNTAFNIDWNQFERLPARIQIDSIEEGKFFTIVKGKCKALRRKNTYKQIAIENNRNIRTFKLNKPGNYKEFKNNTVLALIKPHDFYYHRKPIESHKRFVYDVLNEQFILISFDEYKKIGLNKFARGSLVLFSDNSFTKLKFTGIKNKVNEIEAVKITEEISAVLFDLINKNKYDKMCLKCKNSCKQKYTVVSCKKYVPKIARKKREVSNKSKNTLSDFINEIEGADVGNKLAKEIKKKVKVKNGN